MSSSDSDDPFEDGDELSGIKRDPSLLEKLSIRELRAILGERLIEPDTNWLGHRERRVHNDLAEPDTQKLYLETLAETGTYSRAADSVKVSQHYSREYRKNNPEFQALCAEALSRHRDVFLLEAQRRAVNGVIAPIIGGRNKDEIIAHEIKYSDRLLELFLKRLPDGSFTEKQEVVHSGQMDIRQEMDLRSMSKKARGMLRALLEQMTIDETNRGLGKDPDQVNEVARRKEMYESDDK